MARLSEAPLAPATGAATISITAEPPSIETLEAGKQHNAQLAMRTKPKAQRQDPPANFEEVKRNLIRQNRNLARANSTQSLQIRTLGAEVTRLLSVNLGLKEELISLRSQLRDVRRQGCFKGAGQFRRAMAAHLREMTTMLSSLQDGSPIENSPQASPETRKSICLESMEFRERPTLKEIMASSRMPTIRENKTYSKDRLVASPTRASPVRPTDTIPESPDPGPPPVARLQNLEEPAEVEPESTAAQDEETPACDSVNIETRRRRKLSSSGVLSRRSSAFVSPLADPDASTIFKTGAKRKLADRENSEPPKKSPSKTLHIFDDRTESRTVPIKPARNVLAAKSVNSSPRKIRKVESDSKDGKPEKKDAVKKDEHMPAKTPKARVSSRKSMRIPPPQDLLSDDAPAEIEINLPPITPHHADLLSPLSTEKPSLDTPPPADLSMRSMTSTDDAARPSRRARAAVNYTEPSLVAKMRRPSKAMVDALTGLQDPRKAMTTTGERRTSSTSGRDSLSTSQNPTDVLEDEIEGAVYQVAPDVTMPEARDAEPEVPAKLEPAERSRKLLSLELSSLMAAGKAKRTTITEESALDLAVYDVDDSTTTSSPGAPTTTDVNELVRAGRRHSSAAKASLKSGLDIRQNDSVSTGSRSSTASRRRSMMI